jgi:hypothetical protein
LSVIGVERVNLGARRRRGSTAATGFLGIICHSNSLDELADRLLRLGEHYRQIARLRPASPAHVLASLRAAPARQHANE